MRTLVLALLLGASVIAHAEVVCPRTAEATIAPIGMNSWRLLATKRGHEDALRLSNVIFYNKDPNLNAILKYSESTKTKKGRLDTYRVQSMEVWIVCEYYDKKTESGFRVARKIPSYNRCQVESNGAGVINARCL